MNGMREAGNGRPPSVAVVPTLLLAALLAVGAAVEAAWAEAASAPATTVGTETPASCEAALADPEYYSFELRSTDKVPAVRGATGRVTVSYPPSPFGLPVTRDGTTTHRLKVEVDAPEAPDGGVYVAWASDPNLERISRLGPVDRDGPVTGEIALNKFMVFVTLERIDDPEAARWEGPVVLVGRARSARIQSMASHGTFETEPC